MEDFLSKIAAFEMFESFIAMILISASCAILGVFVLWRRLSYFSDALSHSLILGFVLSNILETNQVYTMLVFAVVFSAISNFVIQNRYFAKDAMIVMSSYFAIAIAFSISRVSHEEFHKLVFGNILNINQNDITSLSMITLLIIIFVIFSFKRMLLININEDLAKISNIKTSFWNVSFMVLLSLLVALSVKMAGVFLVTALLVLPASIARVHSNSAQRMIYLSAMISIFNSVFSFNFASTFSLEVGPITIVFLFSILFVSIIYKKLSATSYENNI